MLNKVLLKTDKVIKKKKKLEELSHVEETEAIWWQNAVSRKQTLGKKLVKSE